VTLYVIPNEDGSIAQANKVWATDLMDYDKLLEDRGLLFIKEATAPDLAHPDHFMVDMKNWRRVERPVMSLSISATKIRAGSKESSVITGIPKGAKYVVAGAGTIIAPQPGEDGTIDDGRLEILIPVPMTYSVTLTLWPYKLFTVDIQGF
jgi:hypothetical protein